MNYKTIYASFLLVVLLFASSCGPVHRFTKVKKIPREYSLNYCGGTQKAPKSDLNKDPWIVYSDRDGNHTFNTPGGKVEAKDVGYLDPFLVIGTRQKGEYLKLIKYTPGILKNGQLDYKKAEYCGWIQKSKLLLNQQSFTDAATGKKNKALAVFSDTSSFSAPDKFFAKDSLKLYKDLELKMQAGAIPPFSVIYRLKQTADRTMSLVAKKTYIHPDGVKEDVLGWINNSLIKDIGTGLHINLQALPKDVRHFYMDNGREIKDADGLMRASQTLSGQYKSIQFSPVLSYSVNTDSSLVLRTLIPVPVFDYGDNYIFNVDGGRISHGKFGDIAYALRRINISFVFEGGEPTITRFPQIVNALQNLQPLFELQDEGYVYRFNCVMAFGETEEQSNSRMNVDFTSDYAQIINYLSDRANKKDKLRPMASLHTSWAALRRAVNSFDKCHDGANLIVLVGDKRTADAGIDPALVAKIVSNNCRILGFQVYGGEGDDYNNFVLDMQDLINGYADALAKTKRNILVSPQQIRRSNLYKSVGAGKNNYRLDFPNHSITQGGLFFPQKNETLPMELLVSNVDTILQQIREDNKGIVQYMSLAFRSAGINRTKYDSTFACNFGLAHGQIPGKKLIGNFMKDSPGWYMPSKIIALSDSLSKTFSYHLMLSETEMRELKEFIASLSEIEVDFLSKRKGAEGQRRKLCDCPEDGLDREGGKGKTHDKENNDVDTGQNGVLPAEVESSGEYADTKGLRKHLTKTFLDPLGHCPLCRKKNSRLKMLSLAEAQSRITGCPTYTQLLKSIRINDLKNKKLVSDKQLDELIAYYKRMKEKLDNAEQFSSNGETYYWINRKLLP